MDIALLKFMVALRFDDRYMRILFETEGAACY